MSVAHAATDAAHQPVCLRLTLWADVPQRNSENPLFPLLTIFEPDSCVSVSETSDPLFS